jgi:hypothetical protein
MQKRDLAAYATLALAVLCLIVCIAVRYSSIVSIFSTIDRAVACLLLLIALGVAIYRSENAITRLTASVLASSSVALGVGMFATIFAASGSDSATLAAIWFSCFAAGRLVQSSEEWTRPAACASLVALIFLLSVENSTLIAIKDATTQLATWIASILLDSAAVSHLYDIKSITLLSGELKLDALSNSWFGVLPTIGLVTLLAVCMRASLVQAILACLISLCTWSCMEGIYAWWVAWSGASSTEPLSLEIGLFGVVWNIAMFLFIALITIMVGATTDPIPLEREDLDYPVTTYFWNLFTRFPASLTSETPSRHQ